MDDPVKAKTRQLGGIPPLVALLSHEIPEIHRNSCGALRYIFIFMTKTKTNTNTNTKTKTNTKCLKCPLILLQFLTCFTLTLHALALLSLFRQR